MGQIKVITDKDFEAEVLEADTSVLAYFWASWCGPCRLVSPSIEWVAENYSDLLKVVKLEVDPNSEVDPNAISVEKYKVEGVSALRLFKNKEVIWSYEGAITKDKLKNNLDEKLN